MFQSWKPRQDARAGFSLPEVLISFFIFSIVIAGLIYGYVQINRMATWASMSLAAQSVAAQGLEQARGAQWYSLGGLDEWPPTTNASGAIKPYLNTNCSLDVPSTGQPIWVTNYITIFNVSVSPPLRQIRSDCVWNYPLTGQVCTNTAVSLRAPDQ